VINDLGGEPVAEAEYDFGYSDLTGFIDVAQVLENTGVSAYQGAAKYLIGEDALLTAALTIHGIEARHAAYLNGLLGDSPFPDAFNPTLTPDEVLAAAGPFIVAEELPSYVHQMRGWSDRRRPMRGGVGAFWRHQRRSKFLVNARPKARGCRDAAR
jgi:hypothetical protein